jgi:hypothetical protein
MSLTSNALSDFKNRLAHKGVTERTLPGACAADDD